MPNPAPAPVAGRQPKRPILNPIAFSNTAPMLQPNGAYKTTFTATRKGVSVSLDAVYENLASTRKQLDLNGLRQRLEEKLAHRERHLAEQAKVKRA